MRYEPLRKKVIFELCIYVGMLVLLGGVVFFLGSMLDESIEVNQTTQRAMSAIDSELNTLRSKYSYIQQNVAVYEEVKKKQAAGELVINRPVVLEKFNLLKEQYSLNNLRVSVEPTKDIKDPAYVRKTSVANMSEASVELDAISDERIYDFMDAVQQQLSGVCKITKVTLLRDRQLDDDVLSALEKNGTFGLIKASIKFTWFSIVPVEVGGATPNAPR